MIQLVKLEIDYGKSIIRRMRSRFINLFSTKDINKCKIDTEGEKLKLINIKGKIEEIGYNMNSLTYSLFIFGIVLVVCLLFLMS